MKQQNSNTKKTLLSSVIVLIVCIAMLLGTTFAWFSDSVSNTGNRIQAGTLDIDLLMDKGSGYESISDGTGDIFKAAAGKAQDSNDTLWEPGKTQVVFLAVQNSGSLALKYNAYIDVTDEGLCDDGSGNSSLECVMLGGVTKDAYAALGLTDWSSLKTKAQELGAEVTDVTEGRKVISTGVLDEIINGEQNERDYVALAVHMKEDAVNTYQGKDAIIDVTIVATQKDAEADGFGSNTYDANAEGYVPPLPVHEKATADISQATGASDIDFIKQTDSRIESASIQGAAAKAILDAAKEGTSAGDVVQVDLNMKVDTKSSTSNAVVLDISLDKVVTINGIVNEAKSGAVTDLNGKVATTVINIGTNVKDIQVNPYEVTCCQHFFIFFCRSVSAVPFLHSFSHFSP